MIKLDKKKVKKKKTKILKISNTVKLGQKFCIFDFNIHICNHNSETDFYSLILIITIRQKFSL